MDYKLNTMVLTAIHVTYPGGLRQYNEDGGAMAYVPGMYPQIRVYLPTTDEKIKDDIQHRCLKLPVMLVYTDEPNFKDMDVDQVYDEVWRILPTLKDKELLKRLTMSISRACVVVNILGKAPVADAQASALSKLMLQISGLKVGAITHRGRIWSVDAPVIRIGSGEKALTQDDELNVRILLHEVNTVDDLLKQI